MRQLFFVILAVILTACEFNPRMLDPYYIPSATASSTPEPTGTAKAEPTEQLYSSTPTPPAILCRVTAEEALNLRSGPGTRYTVIHWLSAGELLTRTDTPPAAHWWEVTTQGGRTGWVNSNFCK